MKSWEDFPAFGAEEPVTPRKKSMPGKLKILGGTVGLLAIGVLLWPHAPVPVAHTETSSVVAEATSSRESSALPWHYGTDLYQEARKAGRQKLWSKAAKDAGSAYEFLAKSEGYPKSQLKAVRAYQKLALGHFYDQELERANRALQKKSYTQAADLANSADQSLSLAPPGIEVKSRRAKACAIAAHAYRQLHDLALTQIYLEKAIASDARPAYKSELRLVNKLIAAQKAQANPPSPPPEESPDEHAVRVTPQQPELPEAPDVPKGRPGSAPAPVNTHPSGVHGASEPGAGNLPQPHKARPVNTYVPKAKPDEGLHLYQDMTNRH